MKTLIVGCGEVGVRVAVRALAAGEQVYGIARSAQSLARIRAVGAEAIELDLDKLNEALPHYDRIIYCAPPPRQEQQDLRLRRFLQHLSQPPQYFVYISTSGVYGDCQGAWVNENNAVAPSTERAQRRADAEQQLHSSIAHATILRVAGIYGPGRLPVKSLVKNSAVLTDADSGWSNRVYLDDLGAITWLACQQHWASSVFNVSDGQPTQMAAYYDYLAELLDLSKPKKISWAQASELFSPMRLSFLRESRKLSNRKLCEEMGYQFVFRDFRAGLRASVKALPSKLF